MAEEEKFAEDKADGPGAGRRPISVRLKLLLWVTGISAIVGIAGTATSTEMGGSSARWIFFIPLLLSLLALASALWLRSVGGSNASPNEVNTAAGLTGFLTWFSGCLAALAGAILLLVLLLLVAVAIWGG